MFPLVSPLSPGSISSLWNCRLSNTRRYCTGSFYGGNSFCSRNIWFFLWKCLSNQQTVFFLLLGVQALFELRRTSLDWLRLGDHLLQNTAEVPRYWNAFFSWDGFHDILFEVINRRNTFHSSGLSARRFDTTRFQRYCIFFPHSMISKPTSLRQNSCQFRLVRKQ